MVTSTENIAAIERLLNVLRSLILTTAIGATIVVLFSQSPTIFHGVEGLIQRLSSIEVGGGRLGFAAPEVEQDIKAQVSQEVWRSFAKNQPKVLALLGEMRSREIRRLLFAYGLAPPCEYENPTSEMAEGYAADIRLKELGLVELIEDGLLTQRNGEIADEKLSRNEPWSIGRPRSCYILKLTDLGLDLRTALIHVLAAKFDPKMRAQK